MAERERLLASLHPLFRAIKLPILALAYRSTSSALLLVTSFLGEPGSLPSAAPVLSQTNMPLTI